MADSVVEIVHCIVDELKQMARSETVVGEPIQVGARTIVPVVKLSVGFGAGGGRGESKEEGSGFGGGGGGGAKIEPAAFIIIDDENIRLLPAKKGAMEGLIESIPTLVRDVAKTAAESKLLGGKSKTATSDDAEDDEESHGED